MTKLKKLKKLNELKHLQILGTPTCTKGNDAKKWNFDATALSTVNLSTLNPVAGTSMTLPGNAPKVYSGEVISFKNIWEKPQQDLKDSKKSKTPEEYNLARRHFITAQSCFDTRDYHGAYHNIQMATDYYSEHVDRFISQFYFLVFQYLHEDHLKIRAHLLEEFRVIKDKLPTYLADHCLIFIARLERINSDRLTIKESDIQATNLKTVLRIESKWPRALVLKMSRALTFPRIDCLDVIYGHAI